MESTFEEKMCKHASIIKRYFIEITEYAFSAKAIYFIEMPINHANMMSESDGGWLAQLFVYIDNEL